MQLPAGQPQIPVQRVPPPLPSRKPESQSRLPVGGWFARALASTTGVMVGLLGFVGVSLALGCGGCIYVASSVANATKDANRKLAEEAEKRERDAAPKVVPSSKPSYGPGEVDAQMAVDLENDPAAEIDFFPTTPAAPVQLPENYVPGYRDALQVGNVEIEITSCKIAKVTLRKLFGDTATSTERHFVVELTVTNTTMNKRVDFSGWSGVSFTTDTSMRDEHDNPYREVSFGSTSKLVGDMSGETINPGKQAKGIVVFEPPIDAANEVTIELAGDAVGVPDSKLRWRIKREEWGG